MGALAPPPSNAAQDIMFDWPGFFCLAKCATKLPVLQAPVKEHLLPALCCAQLPWLPKNWATGVRKATLHSTYSSCSSTSSYSVSSSSCSSFLSSSSSSSIPTHLLLIILLFSVSYIFFLHLLILLRRLLDSSSSSSFSSSSSSSSSSSPSASSPLLPLLFLYLCLYLFLILALVLYLFLPLPLLLWTLSTELRTAAFVLRLYYIQKVDSRATKLRTTVRRR